LRMRRWSSTCRILPGQMSWMERRKRMLPFATF
jgi:hypothetical protein